MTKMDGLLLALAFSSLGCGTMFNGDSQFPGGVPECRQKCAGDGLKMAAYVYMGEYTSGCVCAAPNGDKPSDVPQPGDEQSTAAAAFDGVAAAQAVAVAYQRRRQDSQATAVLLGAVNVGITIAMTSGSDDTQP
jgi:hypothetical protein